MTFSLNQCLIIVEKSGIYMIARDEYEVGFEAINEDGRMCLSC